MRPALSERGLPTRKHRNVAGEPYAVTFDFRTCRFFSRSSSDPTLDGLLATAL